MKKRNRDPMDLSNDLIETILDVNGDLFDLDDESVDDIISNMLDGLYDED